MERKDFFFTFSNTFYLTKCIHNALISTYNQCINYSWDIFYSLDFPFLFCTTSSKSSVYFTLYFTFYFSTSQCRPAHFSFFIYLLIMLLQLSHFPASLHSILPTPFLPHSPTIVHVHGSYLWVLWLLHFLHYSYPPPVYFPPIIYATYSLYHSPPLPLPIPCW